MFAVYGMKALERYVGLTISKDIVKPTYILHVIFVYFFDYSFSNFQYRISSNKAPRRLFNFRDFSLLEGGAYFEIRDFSFKFSPILWI